MQKNQQKLTQIQNADELNQKKEGLKAELDQLLKNLNDMKQDEELQKQLNDNFKQIQSLEKKSIAILKSLNVPPPLIFQICCHLLTIYSPKSQNTWIECKRLLGQTDFVKWIAHLDIESITEEQLEKLNSIDKIDLKQANMISIAAGQICSFLQAVVKIRRSQIYRTNYRINQIRYELGRMEGNGFSE